MHLQNEYTTYYRIDSKSRWHASDFNFTWKRAAPEDNFSLNPA